MIRRILRKMAGAKSCDGEADNPGLSEAMAAEEEVYEQSASLRDSEAAFQEKLNRLRARVDDTRVRKNKRGGEVNDY